MSRKKSSLTASLALQTQSELAVTEDQIRLLEAVRDCGSISAAARKLAISYKTAWDRINQLNNLSPNPLVNRSSGGARGGGTRLTAAGEQVIAGFHQLQEEHTAFMDRLGDNVTTLADVANFMRDSQLRTSARNQYRGTVTGITQDTVSVEVLLEIGDGLEITAQITPTSLAELKLATGKQAVALIKSSWVLLARDCTLSISTRNELPGVVSAINAGKVNSEVVIDLGQGKSICAIVTNTSVDELALQPGSEVCALFKASSVILMAA